MFARNFSLASAALGWATPLLAAEAAPPLDEIVVTAERRAARAQDVGVALTALSGDALRESGVDAATGLEDIAPNLNVEPQFGSGATVFSIRGVGFRDYATNNAPTVGVYLDEVAAPFPVMLGAALFDVERIEVLRGPQGTLYGRNTTGGAINILSRRPTAELSAGASVEFARFGRAEFEGYVSGPLSETVRARISGRLAEGGAWQENRETGAELGDDSQAAIRTLIEWRPDDRAAFLLNLHASKDDGDGLGLALFRPFGPNPPHGPRETSWGASAEFAQTVGFAPDQKPFRDNAGIGGSLTARVEAFGANLVYIAAFEHFDRREYNDYDALPAGVAGVYFKSDIDIMTHEARVASLGAERFNWIGGVYYALEKLDENYQSDFVDSFGPGFAVRTPYEQEAETVAVFGQADRAIGERLKAVLGLRYERETRNLRNLGTFASGFGTLNFANGSPVGALESRRLATDDWSGKAALEYRPDESALVYVSASRGVKSGGFTAYNTLNPLALTPFKPEILWAYEAGFKTAFAGDTARLSGAAFFYDYHGQQVQSAIYDIATGAVVGRIVNAGRSRIFGAEGEFLWAPVKGLSFEQRVGWQNGKYREFDDLDIAATTVAGSAVFTDRSGEDIGAPELTYQGGLSYERPIASTLTGSASFTYSYRGGFTNPLLGPTYAVPGYWLANARVAIARDPWEASIFVRDLFDTRYDQQRNFFAGFDFTPVAARGEPLTFGVGFAMRL